MTSCRLPGCHDTPFSWLDTLVDEPDISWTNSTAHTSDTPSWLARTFGRAATIGTEDL